MLCPAAWPLRTPALLGVLLQGHPSPDAGAQVWRSPANRLPRPQHTPLPPAEASRGQGSGSSPSLTRGPTWTDSRPHGPGARAEGHNAELQPTGHLAPRDPLSHGPRMLSEPQQHRVRPPHTSKEGSLGSLAEGDALMASGPLPGPGGEKQHRGRRRRPGPIEALRGHRGGSTPTPGPPAWNPRPTAMSTQPRWPGPRTHTPGLPLQPPALHRALQLHGLEAPLRNPLGTIATPPASYPDWDPGVSAQAAQHFTQPGCCAHGLFEGAAFRGTGCSSLSRSHSLTTAGWSGLARGTGTATRAHGRGLHEQRTRLRGRLLPAHDHCPPHEQ